QKAIHQHQAISTVYPYAINTIRIMTLLSQEEVKICSAIIRMGIGNMRVDNVSKGGLSCGIQPDGRLKSVAYNYKGEKFYEHPTTGVSFDSVVIPSFDKACKMVRRIHPAVPNYRLISWDIAIDEDANPLLVEANLFYGALNVHQMNNGPVFGDYTQDILDEVFPKE
ncbi:MAG: hypothetical protein IJT40_00695, partial [Firmicutes bacterium]|nr:hypothetical protein [Bacillota bacterium]